VPLLTLWTVLAVEYLLRTNVSKVWKWREPHRLSFVLATALWWRHVLSPNRSGTSTDCHLSSGCLCQWNDPWDPQGILLCIPWVPLPFFLNQLLLAIVNGRDNEPTNSYYHGISNLSSFGGSHQHLLFWISIPYCSRRWRSESTRARSCFIYYYNSFITVCNWEDIPTWNRVNRSTTISLGGVLSTLSTCTFLTASQRQKEEWEETKWSEGIACACFRQREHKYYQSNLEKSSRQRSLKLRLFSRSPASIAQQHQRQCENIIHTHVSSELIFEEIHPSFIHCGGVSGQKVRPCLCRFLSRLWQMVSRNLWVCSHQFVVEIM
jgi:hypothetical protein